jgi:hypothetical protein
MTSSTLVTIQLRFTDTDRERMGNRMAPVMRAVLSAAADSTSVSIQDFPSEPAAAAAGNAPAAAAMEAARARSGKGLHDDEQDSRAAAAASPGSDDSTTNGCRAATQATRKR